MVAEVTAEVAGRGMCGLCQFWVIQPDDSKIGICHRYPPNYDGWAMTGTQDWCGEWTSAASGVEARV